MQVMKFIWNIQKISILILMQISNFQAVKIEIPLVICKKVLLHKKFLHFMPVLGISFYPT